MPKKIKSRKDGSHYPISKRQLGISTRQTKIAHLVVPKKFRKTTVRKTEYVGIPVKKETEEIKISHVPSEITEEKGKSLNVDTKHGLFGIGSSVTTKEKTTSKFPKEKKKTNRKKKPFA